MRALGKTIKENRVTFSWYGLLILFLSIQRAPNGIDGSLVNRVLDYWNDHAAFLFSALGNTLSVAFPVAAAMLIISFSLALAAVYKHIIGAGLKILVIVFSLLPSVYLVHLVRTLSFTAPVNSKIFAGLVLIFSNLVMYFFFLGFKKDIHEEFHKDYHFLARQLGVKSKLVSAGQKLALIAAERLLPLFIMVFSSTIFVESKLHIGGGIYTFLYDTVKSIDISNRPDIFWGQLLFILGFVLLLQLIYGTLLNHIKTRCY